MEDGFVVKYFEIKIYVGCGIDDLMVILCMDIMLMGLYVFVCFSCGGWYVELV